MPFLGGMTGRLPFLVLALLVMGGASEDNVVKLTKFNFDDNVRNGNWFIKFFAPWCTHCQRMKPIWEKLADAAVAKDWPVKIAEVDCTSSKEVCEKVSVKAFPMLALISNGALKGKYAGEASVVLFEEWLTKQLALEVKEAAPSVVQQAAPANPNAVKATAGAAATAIMINLLARFPTENKIINVYFYGGIIIFAMVAVLCVIFRMIEEEEEREAREKTD